MNTIKVKSHKRKGKVVRSHSRKFTKSMQVKKDLAMRRSFHAAEQKVRTANINEGNSVINDKVNQVRKHYNNWNDALRKNVIVGSGNKAKRRLGIPVTKRKPLTAPDINFRKLVAKKK